MLFRLNLKGNLQVYATGFALDNECWRTFEHKVHSLMQEALGERAKLVRVIWRNTSSECNFEDVREQAVKPNLSVYSFVFIYTGLIFFHYRVYQCLIEKH